MNRRKRYELEDVYIASLLFTNYDLTDFSFYKCRIRGPAILVVGSSIIRNISASPSDSMYWTLPEDTVKITGMVVAENCLFENCHFHGVGFAGKPEDIDKLRRWVTIRPLPSHLEL